MISKRLNRLVPALTLVALVASGCADIRQKAPDRAPQDSYSQDEQESQAPAEEGDLGATQASDGIGCPAEPNLKPYYDWDIDGSGHFKGCQTEESKDRIVIRGRPPESPNRSDAAKKNIICVFPALYQERDYKNPENTSDETHDTITPYRKLDSATGELLYKCVYMSEGKEGLESVVAFPSAPEFNAVFVVEESYKEEMKNCLTTENGNLCNHYSFGVFR